MIPHPFHRFPSHPAARRWTARAGCVLAAATAAAALAAEPLAWAEASHPPAPIVPAAPVARVVIPMHARAAAVPPAAPVAVPATLPPMPWPAPTPGQDAGGADASPPAPRPGPDGGGAGGEGRRPRGEGGRREGRERERRETPPAVEEAPAPRADNEWNNLVNMLASRPPVTKELFYYECKSIAAADLKTIINEFISDTGRVAPAKESEMLIVEDTPDKIAAIRQICERIDQRVPQVLVEAQIVELKLTNDFEKEVNLALVATGASSFVQNIFAGLTATDSTSAIPGPGGLPTNSNYGGAITIRPWRNDKGDSLTAMFRMLERRGKAKILSSPNLVLRRGVTGNIFTGEDYPIPEQNATSGGVSTGIKFRKIGIGLTVTPRMIKDDTVRLYVKPEVSSLSGREKINDTDVPLISMRSAETELEMRDGEVLSIGGLLSEDEIVEVRKVPGLGSIPGVGGLFRGSDRLVVKKQLAIFLSIRMLPESRPGDVTVIPTDDMPQPVRDEIQRIEMIHRPDRSRKMSALREDWFRLVEEGYE